MNNSVNYASGAISLALLIGFGTGCHLPQNSLTETIFKNESYPIQARLLAPLADSTQASEQPVDAPLPTIDKGISNRSSNEVFAAHYPETEEKGNFPNLAPSLPLPQAAPAPAPTQKENSPKFTLDQVINATLLADPKLRAGFEAINQAQGEALTASLRPNPTFGISQTLMPLIRPFTEDLQGGPPQLDLGVSYRIDWFLFGKRAAALQAAKLGVKVSEAEFADLIRQRVQEVATTYYDVLEAKSLLQLAQQDAANLKQVEDLTKKAVEGGGRPQVELGRIRLDRLRAEQAVRDSENNLIAAKARLWALMGRDEPDTNFDVAGSLEEIPIPQMPPLEESLKIATQNRPDLEGLRRKVAQANAAIISERKQGLPEITPQVGYTRQFQERAIGFPDANSYGFGIEMTLPFSDRNQGNIYRATSIAVQQRFELQAALVELRSEVVQAYQELRTVQANAKAVAEEQLKLASEVRDSLNKAYEAGGRPLIDVLDAQRNYRETYRLYIESRANLGRAGIKFNATLGKKVTP
ncbi:MAG: TolC family protein [Gemmataceae bacterium]|jgi:cobalt-zinc-cadmium efflux system outer membrane protein|nr:TolC family protein [Gemmataceae bacterium]